MLRTPASIAFALVVGTVSVAHAAPTWTPWVSEENGSPFALCPATTTAVNGFDCDGSWCDNVRLQCETLPYGITVDGYNVSEFFSEESPGFGTAFTTGWYPIDDDHYHVCNGAGDAGVMTGIACSGSNCDSIAVECATPSTHFEGVTEPVELVDCSWSAYISEEDPPLVVAPGYFVSGVACNGWYCDNKSFLVCRMQGPANSCMGECGGEARAGCFCDEACVTFDDCCSDFEAVCLPV